MEPLVQSTNCLVATGSESIAASSRRPNSNQRFLLYFIFSTYFRPHLKEEFPQKSVLQRVAEGLSAYTSDQLAGSHMKTVEVERVYYYALRKVEKSLAVKLPILHQFFHGSMPTSENDLTAVYPQFPDLFPPQLHPHSRFKNKYRTIENIIFIHDPDTSYIKPEEIERFKRLTGLENLLLDGQAARCHISLDDNTLYNVPVQEAESIRDFPLVNHSHRSRRAKRPASTLQSVGQHVHDVDNALPPLQSSTTLPIKDDTRTVDKADPGIFFLPSCPNNKERDQMMAASKSGLALTGSAAMGQVGPSIGLVDIGECEDAYMFRVSLPGVKRDWRKFSYHDQCSFPSYKLKGNCL